MWIPIVKKSFSILSLLAPPQICSDEYNSYIYLNKNVKVDRLLDQPDDKKRAMRKDVFIKGRQDSISDIISFVANIVCFAQFWVKMDQNNTPLVEEMLVEIADFISSSEYSSFGDMWESYPWAEGNHQKTLYHQCK